MLEALQSLDANLKARGSSLVVRTGRAEHIFAGFHKTNGIEAIHCHCNAPNQDRDPAFEAVEAWCLHAGVPFRESAYTGIQADRPNTSPPLSDWLNYMHAPRRRAPDRIEPHTIPSDPWPKAEDFGLNTPMLPCDRGRRAAIDWLNTLKQSQHLEIQRDRLDEFLKTGVLSVREIYQSVQRLPDALRTPSTHALVDALKDQCGLSQGSIRNWDRDRSVATPRRKPADRRRHGLNSDPSSTRGEQLKLDFG